MAKAITFDTLQYAKKAREVGFTEQQAEFQAEAMAEIIDEQLASKRDIKELDDHLTFKIKELDDRLTFKIEELSNKLVIQLGGIVLGAVGVATAILAIVIKL